MILLVACPNMEKLGFEKTVIFKDIKINFTLQKGGEPFLVTSGYVPAFLPSRFVVVPRFVGPYVTRRETATPLNNSS